MIPIVFSIPVHEKLEVVIDQIINFKFFNYGCSIVLHLNENFDYKNSKITKSRFQEIIKDIDNIYVNPQSLRTGKENIIQAHLSNFEYIKSKFDFEYFSICASNELFIKHGLYQRIKKYDCGIGYLDINAHTDWLQGKKAKKDKILAEGILKDIGGTKIVGSQVEGIYFRKSLFNDVSQIIQKYYDYRLMETAYAREEVYFSTIIWNLKDRNYKINVSNEGPFTYMPWDRDLQITIKDIDYLQMNNDHSFFSVKRIDRELNNYVRNYIREKAGYRISESLIYKELNVFETKLFLEYKNIGSIELLKDIIKRLTIAKDQNLNTLFKDIVSQLEYEYGNFVLEEISSDSLDIIKLLIEINEITNTFYNTPSNYIILPLQKMLLKIYSYELLKKINQSKKIVLYGAGSFGISFLNFLKKHNLSQKVFSFVSTLEEKEEEICGIPVVTLSKYLVDSDTLILITVGKRFKEEIEEHLQRLGYKDYENVKEEFLDAITKDLDYF